MKQLLFLGVLFTLLLASCSSDEPVLTEAMTRSEAAEQPQHVSKADFEKYAIGKIWACCTPDALDFIGELSYVNSEGEYDLNLLTGYWRSRAGFLMTSDVYVEFVMKPYERYGVKPMSCAYEYDETTGMINCSMMVNCFGVNEHSLYVEKLTEDELVLREDFGILPIGYNMDDYSWTSNERDPESYTRVKFVAVDDADAEAWGLIQLNRQPLRYNGKINLKAIKNLNLEYKAVDLI